VVISLLKTKEDPQFTCDVTLRQLRVKIVAVEERKLLLILNVSLQP